MYSVYFAKSLKNGKIYVGFTNKDAETRVKEHNQSSNQWSTNNKPLKLIYYEKFFCETDAREREKFFKSGVGRRLKEIIAENWTVLYNTTASE